MLEVAIIGGGLCGLALADALQAQGSDYAVFEARPRTGGRILSAARGDGGSRLDLGPSWYWPETQPRMAALVEKLALDTIAQHDTGTVLRLNDTDKAAQRVPFADVHGGARRMVNGTAMVVEALQRRLPAERLHLEHILTTVQDRIDHVELHFRTGDATVAVHARRVVIAIPPRLVDEQVRFGPALDGPLRAAMRNTPTWMADRAKVAIAYPRACWREAGHSGNAFVTHEQAVIGEVFDACDDQSAALGGFIALSPMLRVSFREGLPLLIDNQMTQVFGASLEGGEQHCQDWATERYTCAVLDHLPSGEHPQYGDPLLRRTLWDGKLHFGSAETASHGGGYMEGALESAARIARDLDRTAAAVTNPIHDINESSISRFTDWVAGQRHDALQRYRRHLNQGMAAQQKEQLTQRALLGTIEQIYSEALQQIHELPLDARGAAIERGRSALTPELLDPFDGFINTLIDEVVVFNRTSCAMSNFPFEHAPDADYLMTIKRDLVAAWREFAVAANAVVLAKSTREGITHGE